MSTFPRVRQPKRWMMLKMSPMTGMVSLVRHIGDCGGLNSIHPGGGLQGGRGQNWPDIESVLHISHMHISENPQLPIVARAYHHYSALNIVLYTVCSKSEISKLGELTDCHKLLLFLSSCLCIRT